MHPRSASKSVEDIVENKRISSLSMTSGCSDCTTATLQVKISLKMNAPMGLRGFRFLCTSLTDYNKLSLFFRAPNRTAQVSFLGTTLLRLPRGSWVQTTLLCPQTTSASRIPKWRPWRSKELSGERLLRPQAP